MVPGARLAELAQKPTRARVLHVAASAERARAIRERTVPTGTCQDLGDLVVGEIADVTEHHGGAKLDRERGEGGVDVHSGGHDVGRVTTSSAASPPTPVIRPGRRSGVAPHCANRSSPSRSTLGSDAHSVESGATNKPGASEGDLVGGLCDVERRSPSRVGVGGVASRRCTRWWRCGTATCRRSSARRTGSGRGWPPEGRPGWRRGRRHRCRASAGTVRAHGRSAP